MSYIIRQGASDAVEEYLKSKEEIVTPSVLEIYDTKFDEADGGEEPVVMKIEFETSKEKEIEKRLVKQKKIDKITETEVEKETIENGKSDITQFKGHQGQEGLYKG